MSGLTRLIVRIAVLAVVTLVASPAEARQAAVTPPAGQGAGSPPPQGRTAPPPQPEPGALTAAQVEQEFDNFALGQAQRQLGLAEAQYFRFARAYRALQAVKRRAQRQRRVLMAELGAMIRPAGPVENGEAVTARLKALDDHAVQTAIEIQRAHVAIDGVLNLRQRVRFRQFDQQMERKKQELLALAQGAARGRGSPPGGG